MIQPIPLNLIGLICFGHRVSLIHGCTVLFWFYSLAPKKPQTWTECVAIMCFDVIMWVWRVLFWENIYHSGLMVCTFLLEGGQRSRICQPFPRWSVPRPGWVMTRLSSAMVTEHSERVTPGVISLDVRVRRREPCSIIHLINVSRQLMNIHAFHLSDGEETEKKA